MFLLEILVVFGQIRGNQLHEGMFVDAFFRELVSNIVNLHQLVPKLYELGLRDAVLFSISTRNFLSDNSVNEYFDLLPLC